MSPGAELLELRRLAEQVQELRESHDALLRQLAKPADRRTGAALLPLVADVVGLGAVFDAASLAARALNDRTPDGAALRELIGEYATESGGLRAFGRLLDRLDGVPLAAYRLAPAGEGRDGRRWRVLRVSRA